MKRLLAFTLALLSLASCARLIMDPYEGGDGVRANINGRKCTMIGHVGSTDYASYSIYSDSVVFVSTANLANRELSLAESYRLDIKLKTSSLLLLNTDYRLSSADASITDPGSSGADPLSGWIRFLFIDPDAAYIEASFELSSSKHVIKHGFMRLPIDYTDHTGS